jgi:hypothetical protein
MPRSPDNAVGIVDGQEETRAELDDLGEAPFRLEGGERPGLEAEDLETGLAIDPRTPERQALPRIDRHDLSGERGLDDFAGGELDDAAQAQLVEQGVDGPAGTMRPSSERPSCVTRRRTCASSPSRFQIGSRRPVARKNRSVWGRASRSAHSACQSRAKLSADRSSQWLSARSGSVITLRPPGRWSA